MRTVLIVAAVMLCGSAMAQDRERAAGMFERADTNGDGLVSRDEFSSARIAQFAKRDRNGNGAIDSSDVGARAAARPRVGQAMTAMLNQLDANHDGKISQDEFVAGGLAIFDRADADRSGSLDAKELEGAKAAAKTRTDFRTEQ